MNHRILDRLEPRFASLVKFGSFLEQIGRDLPPPFGCLSFFPCDPLASSSVDVSSQGCEGKDEAEEQGNFVLRPDCPVILSQSLHPDFGWLRSRGPAGDSRLLRFEEVG